MKIFAYIAFAVLIIGFCVIGCSQDSGKSVEALNGEAMQLLQSGQKDQALEKAMAALEKAEKESGADSPNTVMSLEIMGLAHQAMGEPEDAEIAFLRALSAVRKAAGPDSVEAAKITNNLASLYYAQNRYNLALSFFKQSLAIGEKQFPANDPRLPIMRKNIEVCEGILNGGSATKSTEEEKSAPADSAPADIDSAGASQTDSPVQAPSVNLNQDMVPEQVKESMTSQLAKQNIFISDLEPLPPVLIENKGAVFPYNALKKGKDNDSAQKIVVLFAAIQNPENPNAMIFQQCRLISQTSYQAALEKGGVVQLKKELQEVFPNLYL